MGTLKISLKNLLLAIGAIIIVAGFAWVVGHQPLLDRQPQNTPEPSKATKRVCVTAPVQPTFVNQPGQRAPTPTALSTVHLVEPGSTALPYAVAKITDMNPNAPDKEKTFIYVFHCDGSIELFKVVSSGNMDKDIPLLADDVVLDWIPPASLMGSRPPTLKDPHRHANAEVLSIIHSPMPISPCATCVERRFLVIMGLSHPGGTPFAHPSRTDRAGRQAGV
jgi:hypothetical protein